MPANWEDRSIQEYLDAGGWVRHSSWLPGFSIRRFKVCGQVRDFLYRPILRGKLAFGAVRVDDTTERVPFNVRTGSRGPLWERIEDADLAS